VFYRPQHPYTQQLLAAVPHLGSISAATPGGAAAIAVRESAPSAAADTAPGGAPVVELRGIAIEYPRRGRTPAFRAVDHVDLTVNASEVVGLVGESGSGKTTIGRAIVGLLPFVEGQASVLGVDMIGASKEQ